MPFPTITGVHLIGSVPLPTTEEVFTTLSQSLPNGLLKRIPDGEVGERGFFVSWQGRILAEKDFILNELFRKLLKLEPTRPELSAEEVESGRRELEAWEIKTEWDSVALESYKTFDRLKKAGVVAKDVRFLVSLPTAVTMTALAVGREFQDVFEVAYERALMKVVERLQSTIPREELSIQFDCPLEMGILEGSDIWNSGRGVAWFEDDKLGYIVKALARLCGSVGESVEMGIHLCYGDQAGHFMDPKDTSLMVEVAKGVLERVDRKVNFLHMPVPKGRWDGAYFAPLRDLKSYIDDGMELSLGLVHADDLEGSRRCIEAAGEFVPRFSVSTECGLGRLSPEKMQSVLEIFAAVAAPSASCDEHDSVGNPTL